MPGASIVAASTSPFCICLRVHFIEVITVHSHRQSDLNGLNILTQPVYSVSVGRVKMPSSREATAAATEPLADGDTTGMSSLENHTSHTDTVSLSVAFVFGICFLLTVVVLLGRRWIEGMKETHKRGYTRISYLLNGDTHCMN